MAAKNGHNCSSFVLPSCLRDLLDLFGKLEDGSSSEVKKEVLKELKNRLTGGDKNNGWVRDGPQGIQMFYKEEGKNNGTGCVLPKSIAGLKELRNSIDKSSNPYHLPNDNPSGDPCVKKYADAIIQNAFPLFGCLFYLWFMCDSGASTIRPKNSNGGSNGDWHWQNEYANGTGTSYGTQDNLFQFLTDQSGTHNVLTLRRCFPQDNSKLQSNKGQQLFKDGSAHTLFGLNNPGGHFQQALFFLLFLAPRWCHAMSGHALLFLDWFNNKATSVFSGVQWLHVTKAGDTYFKNCDDLKSKIEGLSKVSGQEGISPVHTESVTGRNYYNSIFNTSFNGNDPVKKAHVFMQYVSWLWWCIPHLTASLREMSEDSSKWKNGTDNNPFENSTTFGPFPWGFTFTNTNGNDASQLNGKLNALIQAIEQFKCCIEAFFWAIRRPFACGSLAAWILAFTFLLYVNLLPLDLFHIQSHYNVFSFNRGPIRPLHEVSYFSGA